MRMSVGGLAWDTRDQKKAFIVKFEVNRDVFSEAVSFAV